MTTVGRAQRHFGHGRGVYTCCQCGRQTRETTVQGSDHCADCYELAGLQNAVFDGCFTEADIPERDAMLAAIVRKGGDGERVKASLADLFKFPA